jgi:hypothetical protein
MLTSLRHADLNIQRQKELVWPLALAGPRLPPRNITARSDAGRRPAGHGNSATDVQEAVPLIVQDVVDLEDACPGNELGTAIKGNPRPKRMRLPGCISVRRADGCGGPRRRSDRSRPRCFGRLQPTRQALDSCGGDAYIRKWNPLTARQGGNPCRRVPGRHDTPL